MGTPLISVVIPVYNEERYLQRCIDSLLKQTYRPFEIIFIDDGSEDGTAMILKQNARRYANIRFYRQKNAGPGAARNRGARLAKGSILVFVDADMTFDRRYIEVLTKPVREGKVFGTTHTKELCANRENIWARSWSINRIVPSTVKHGCRVYRAILRKKFLDTGGFDPSRGYFDDNLGHLGFAAPVSAVCFHNNPETLGEAFSHSMWVGRSLVRDPEVKRSVAPLVVGSFVLVTSAIGFAFVGILWPLYVVMSIAALAWLMISVVRTVPRLVDEGRYEYLFSIPVLWVFRLAGYYLGALQQLWKTLAR